MHSDPLPRASPSPIWAWTISDPWLGSRPVPGVEEGEGVRVCRTNAQLPPHLPFSSQESSQKYNSNCSTEKLTGHVSQDRFHAGSPAYICSWSFYPQAKILSAIVCFLQQSPLKIMASYEVHAQGKFPRWGYFSVDEGQGCRAEQNSPSFSCISHLEKLMLYIFQSICLLEAETEAKFSRCVRSVGGRAIQSCLHIQPNHIQGLFLQPCRLGGKSFTPWLGREIIQYPLGDVLHYVQIQTKIIWWIPSYFPRVCFHKCKRGISCSLLDRAYMSLNRLWQLHLGAASLWDKTNIVWMPKGPVGIEVRRGN